MQVPNKKVAPFSFHRCVFYLSLPNGFSERKTWRLRMRFKNRVLVLRREQQTNNSYRMLRFESFVFTCLTYRNV